MGRRNTEAEQKATVEWAQNYLGTECTLSEPSLSGIKSAFAHDLRSYFSVAALSRSRSAPRDLVESALTCVFRTRVRLEQAIVKSLQASAHKVLEPLPVIFAGSFYGVSKKQGVSIRFALTGCHATKACANACYAHDALDASPNAVVRGALNHFIATFYEKQEPARAKVLAGLRRHTRRAVSAATAEAESVDGAWVRDPRIRFAHVGEAAAYPTFSNELARQVKDLSDGKVTCVVYSRHRDARLLDPDLFVINFTLDASSEERRAWIPRGARPVFSAFGGRVSSEVAVNFLEHHRWSHLEPVGSGEICPVTLPASKTRTCDAALCDLCFRPFAGRGKVE